MTDADHVRAGVVVIGAGPAGIAAAVAAAERGVRVVVVDRGLEPGGQIWRHRPGATLPSTAMHWLARLDGSGAQLVRGASVVDARCTADGVAAQRACLVAVRDGMCVETTGGRASTAGDR